MERFGELAKREPKTGDEMRDARAEIDRLERVSREDVENAVAFLREVVGTAGSYCESIPLDESGRINRKSFAESNNTGRNLLERAHSVPATFAGFNAFMAEVEKRCPNLEFTLSKKGDLLNLKVESRS